MTEYFYSVPQTKRTSNFNVCNHEIKLTLPNISCIRNEEFAEECITTAKVLNNHAELKLVFDY